MTLETALNDLFEGRPPFRVRLWDGTEYGPSGDDEPVVVIHTPLALRYILWRPGELGLARAYVTGTLDVEGDLAEAFRKVRASAKDLNLTPGLLTEVSRLLARTPRVLGPPLPAPRSEARLRGRLNTPRRDQAAIAHHYDLSNAFYGLILDETMAYSCAYFEPGDTLAKAQRRKLDLICHKLRLEPGMRLLDVGCGWGSLLLYAAHEYGVEAVGYTLSREQKEFVEGRARARGLRAAVELRDYRDIDDEPYDAVASIEMGEHVGSSGYPRYAATLQRMVRPGGRVLVQQMSREGHPGGGPFIETYIAPDMHMRPVGETIDLLAASGLEFEHAEAMGDHYAQTAWAWHETFESRYSEVVELVGREQARVWRLYLIGGGLAFEQGRMDVHQLLLRRRA
ncbi:class I SAM-dependent methyltransferase [Actinomadura barringtoniae]|uniref:Class I SAM-dependent methyltransferase n=1 Tax=Actinomadura barringtoniae TaxID=1427535 RepID=A0A939T917_9ACTN|nr:cyclopropane-fatty-acyl-phospholipid synthase family protein [Actinomadura barringtoniae]MBO2450922.1 class I SAM-dependent methyltransferase [Actinomadura barringtoniae]